MLAHVTNNGKRTKVRGRRREKRAGYAATSTTSRPDLIRATSLKRLRLASQAENAGSIPVTRSTDSTWWLRYRVPRTTDNMGQR
jgi:hypothetical protein